jgi:hypothetical protein
VQSSRQPCITKDPLGPGCIYESERRKSYRAELARGNLVLDALDLGCFPRAKEEAATLYCSRALNTLNTVLLGLLVL